MKFKLFSTNIYVSFYFCAYFCILLLSDQSGTALPLICGIACHEIMHLLVMWILSCEPKTVSIVPGGINIVGRNAVSYRQQLYISISGPIINLIGSLVFLIYYLAYHDAASFFWFGSWFILGFINLLPSKGLDGGTALYSYFASKFSEEDAARKVMISSILTAMIFLITSIYLIYKFEFNITFIIFSIYLFVCSIAKI